MQTQDTSLAQRSSQKLHFDHKDMDFYLGWIMGREIYAGSRADECRAVAARIPDGDLVAWHREWQGLAERVEAEARAALTDGDRERARAAPTCGPAPTFGRRCS